MKLVTRFLILLILSPLALAVPNAINYQGRLLDNNGIPVTDPAVDFTVSIWTAASGGLLVYQEDHLNLAVDDGVYNFEIGNGTNGTPAWNPSSFFNTSSPRYLQLIVNGETLTPRHQLLSAPFTLQSGNSDKLGNQSPGYYGTAAQVSSLQTQISSLQTQVSDLQQGMQTLCNASATSKWSYKNNLCFGGAPQCKGLDFTGESFPGVTLTNADCSGADFKSVDFTLAIFNATNFSGAKFGSTNLEGVSWGLNTICPDGFQIKDPLKDTCFGHL